MSNEIFVFGSNTAGIHGAGAAKMAWQVYGAQYRVGYGMCGQSFAIPTKDKFIQTLPTAAVEEFVKGFLAFARDRDDLIFKVTRIGCGLAGFQDCQIAPMFDFATKNCQFDTKWEMYLPQGFTYWGTY